MISLSPPEGPRPIAVKQIISHDGDLWVVDGAGHLWHGWYNQANRYVTHWTVVDLPEAN